MSGEAEETEIDVSERASELASRIGKARAKDNDDEGAVEVQEPPEADEDDDEKEEAREKSRVERRSERGKERLSLRERAAAAEARAEAYREQLERGGRAPQREEQQPSNGEIAKLEQRYVDVVTEQEKLFNEYQRAQNLTPAQEADFRRRASVLDLRKTNIAVELREVHTAPQRAREEKSRALAMRAPDVYGNERALQYAAAEFQRRVALGEPDTTDLHDRVCEEARQVILGKRPPPDAAQRARATGMSSGTRPGAAPEPVRLSMPKGSPMYRMAVAMYPEDDAGVACQKWANKHGKKYAEAIRGK